MSTETIQPTAEQMALAGPGYGKDELASFLEEIREEDAAIESGTIEPPAPAADPEYSTMTVEGDEVEEEEAERPLAGKFKSAEELEKAYLELQRKLGQPREEQQDQPPLPEPQAFSRDEAVGYYGENVVAAAEREGINLAAWDAAVQRGEDTSAMREKLANAMGIPAQLIEQYEASTRQQAPQQEQQQAPLLAPEEEAAIKNEVGGEQQFQQLSQWALKNLSPQELQDYNNAINTGNASAARAAVRWLATKAQTADSEPQLIMANGTNSNPAMDVFETEEEAIEAKAVLTKGGKPRYLVDSKYRRYIDAKFARSNIFM